MKAQERLYRVGTSLQLRSLSTTTTMQTPKIRKIGPLPSEEAKWTELRKIEVRTDTTYHMPEHLFTVLQWIDQV